jgi:dihydroorotase
MVKDRRVTGARVASELTLVEYMAFFLELGFALEDVIRMTTSEPASAAGIDATAGSLVEGRPADISVLEVLTGRFTLTDVTGVSRLGERAIVPSVTVKDGRVFPAGRGAHPWGFAPPPAAN